MLANVRQGGLTVLEPREVGRPAVGAPAPGLLGIGDPPVAGMRGERKLVPVRQPPRDLLVGPGGDFGGWLASDPRRGRDLLPDADAVQGLRLRPGRQGKECEYRDRGPLDDGGWGENNGFAFVERLLDERPDGLRLFNSYEVEGRPGLVVTFVTKMSKTDAQRLKSKQDGVDINRSARLDSIILGDAGYLKIDLGSGQAEGKEVQTNQVGVDPAVGFIGMP